MSELSGGTPTGQDYELPDYGFDVVSGQPLVGQIAIDGHIEAGGHPADIRKLGEILLSNDKDFTRPDRVYPPKGEFNRNQAIQDGRFIISIIRQHDPDSSLNYTVLTQAERLGLLTYSIKRIKNRYKSQNIVGYLKDVGVDRIRKRAYFDHLGIDGIVKHLKMVGDEEECIPTTPILRRRIKDGKDEPSPEIIRRIAKRHNPDITFHHLFVLAGYPEHMELWEEEDYIDWAVAVMLANKGVYLTEPLVDYFSSKKLGPSTHPILKHIGGIVSLRNKALEKRKQQLEQRQSMLNDIDKRLQGPRRDEVLASALEEVIDTDEDELILRYAKYIVLNDLLGTNNTEGKVSIITNSTKNAQEHGFAAATRHLNNTITHGDIEVSARSLGVFDIIWPIDYSHLRLPEGFFTPQQKDKLRYVAD